MFLLFEVASELTSLASSSLASGLFSKSSVDCNDAVFGCLRYLELIICFFFISCEMSRQIKAEQNEVKLKKLKQCKRLGGKTN